MLAIMFRLGLGMAHAGIAQGALSVSGDDEGVSQSVYCGPVGEQEILRLVDMLCPVCHALSSVDDQEESLHKGPDLIVVGSSVSEYEIYPPRSSLPVTPSVYQSRAPPSRQGSA